MTEMMRIYGFIYRLDMEYEKKSFVVFLRKSDNLFKLFTCWVKREVISLYISFPSLYYYFSIFSVLYLFSFYSVLVIVLIILNFNL